MCLGSHLSGQLRRVLPCCCQLLLQAGAFIPCRGQLSFQPGNALRKLLHTATCYLPFTMQLGLQGCQPHGGGSAVTLQGGAALIGLPQLPLQLLL
jgi:hypothetical protein